MGSPYCLKIIKNTVWLSFNLNVDGYIWIKWDKIHPTSRAAHNQEAQRVTTLMMVLKLFSFFFFLLKYAG